MSNNKKIRPSSSLRLCILITAIFLPIILLSKGLYGSFIFTFSIPLLWQVALRGESVSSLGLRRKLSKQSLIVGFLTGVIFALVGGKILNFLGLNRYTLSDFHKLQYTCGLFKISFPLQKEVGYRLLTASNTLRGGFSYLFFSIFIIGLGEELFWRGFIQQKISRHFPKAQSIWFAAILFSLAHFYIFIILPAKEGVFLLIAIAIIGAFWGYLFEYFNNIWGPAISHGIAAFIIWKYYLFASLY